MIKSVIEAKIKSYLKQRENRTIKYLFFAPSNLLLIIKKIDKFSQKYLRINQNHNPGGELYMRNIYTGRLGVISDLDCRR